MINITPSPYSKPPLNWTPHGLIAKYSAVVNVSDTPEATFDLLNLGFPAFWFPIHEVHHWGYSPFYGAAKVYDQFNSNPKPILFHCHAGVNRSRCVVYAILKAIELSDNVIAHLTKSDVSDLFQDNIKKEYIPKDIIPFLRARYDYPTYGIMGLLQKIDSPDVYLKRAKVDDLIAKLGYLGSNKTVGQGLPEIKS